MKRSALHGIASLVVALATAGCETLDPLPGPQPGDTPPLDLGLAGDLGGAFDLGGGGSVDARVDGDGSPDPRPDDGIDGRLLYFRYCAVCHGPEGSGGPSAPESIRGLVDTYDVVHNGLNEMPAFPSLSREDVLAIERFLATDPADLPDGGVPGVDPGAPDPTPLTPREQYAVQCAVCHGVEGDGTPRGPQIRFPVLGYANWVVRNGRAGIGYPERMEPFSREQLSDEALQAILSWLGSFEKPMDGAGLNRVFCANCHGADGRGGPVDKGILGDDLYDYLYVIREGEGERDYRDREEYMPAWSEAELSNDDVAAIWLHLTGGVPIDDDDDDHDEGHDEDEHHDEYEYGDDAGLPFP